MQPELWSQESNIAELRSIFQSLVNDVLPATYQYPVRFNHCFSRIILDWLFKDAWYYHLNKSKTAVNQLTETQLQAAIRQMKLWLTNQNILIKDNADSLHYRDKSKS